MNTLPNPDNLISGEVLLKRLGPSITAKKFGELRRKRLIPYVKLGHRTYVYDEVAVRRALKKLIVKEIEP